MDAIQCADDQDCVTLGRIPSLPNSVNTKPEHEEQKERKEPKEHKEYKEFKEYKEPTEASTPPFQIPLGGTIVHTTISFPIILHSSASTHTTSSSRSDSSVQLNTFTSTISDKELENAFAKKHQLPIFSSIIQVYGKGQAVCVVNIVFSAILLYALSTVNFKATNPTPTLYFNTYNFTSLTVIYFVLGLSIFSAVLFYLIYGSKLFNKSRFYIPIGISIAIYIGLPFLLYGTGVPYWFYHIDTLLLVVVYCSLSFALGYFGYIGSDRKKRMYEGAMILSAELFVAVSALVYAMVLMGYYEGYSDLQKALWRAFFHPFYYEIFTLIPVRFLVQHHVTSSTTKNLMYYLAIVHAQSHAAAMGRVMIPSIENVGLITLTVFLLNVLKLLFRVFSKHRDLVVYKCISRFFDIKEYSEESRGVTHAVEIQTDIMSEASATVLAACTLYLFNGQQQLFMFPSPQNGVTIASSVEIVAIQLGIGFIFDIAAMYLSERYNKVPISGTWKMMWAKRHTFFGFYSYGLFAMGLIGVLWIQFKVPRITSCTTTSVCSCSWMNDCDAFIKSI